jgi:tRNA1(Val) A37 N6-methylase TrmN6
MGAESSTDAFHRGAFHAVQPLKTGHRAGSEALLMAAALPQGASGRLADLGAGAGVAALAALAMNPGLSADLVELDPLMADFARQTLALPENVRFASRARVIEADIRLAGARRRAAGLDDNSFDFVIANPPYHAPAERPSPDRRRALAHRMEDGGIEAWLKTAAAILRPGGMAVIVWRPRQLAELFAAAAGRFGDLRILPLFPRENAPAGRIIIRMQRGSRAPLQLLPGIVLHKSDNSPSEKADALLNGSARLHFD